LASEGASVVVGDLQQDKGGEVVQQIKSSGQQALYQSLDVTRSGQWADAVRAAEQHFGRLDIMVDTAGANYRVGFEEQTEEMWDKVMAVNAKGCFLGVKAVAPAMRQAGGGAIVIIASVAAFRGGSGGPAYSCSKAAAYMLARCAAHSFAKDKIRVNAVLPGHIDTPFLRGVKPYSLNTPQTDISIPENYERRLRTVPWGRMGRPEDIAKAVLFLVSDEAEYITGIALVVDGGVMA
jgi:NAD(P)-dependent dehydrogenase (short-subunit alcohol dehydrogenase family)